MKNKTLPLSVCFLLLLAACEIQKTSDSSVNALPINTEMVSSEQSFYPYKEIFPSLDGLSSSTALSGKYVTSFVDAYHGQTQLGTIYTGTASYGQTVNMKIMVGMSTANGKTVLGKVSILNNGATGGFDTTVVANYVTPYNADPSDTTLANVKCGATAAATSIKMIVEEAREYYQNGNEEPADSQAVVAPIFSSSAYGDEEIQLTDPSYVRSYTSVYSSSDKNEYLGTIYRLIGVDSGTQTSLSFFAGFSGSIFSPVYRKIVLIKGNGLEGDVASYNAAPSASQFDSWTNATAGVLAKAMMEEAASLYSSGVGVRSDESFVLGVYPTVKAIADPVTYSDTNFIQHSFRAYSDRTMNNLLGQVYEGNGISDGFEPYEGSGTHYSTITLFVGISGSHTSPVLGKIVLKSDDSFDGAGIPENYLADYNSNPSESALGNTVYTGATYSMTLIKHIVEEALTYYKAGQ